MSSSFEDTRAPIFAPRHFFDIMVPYSEQPLSLHQHPHDIEFDSYSLPPPLERPDLLDDMMLATSEESAAMSELLADNSLLQTSPFRDEMLFGRFAESNPDGCSSSSSSLLSSKSDADFYHHRDAADYMFEHALRAADRNVPEHDEQLHNDDWAADLYATYSACSNIEELETAVATCCAASPSSSSSSSSASWSSAATAVPLTRSHSNPRTTLASASDSKAPDENRAEQHRTLCAAIDCSHHADAESMLCTTHREHFREFVCGAQAANCTIVYTPISPVPNFEQDIVRRIFLPPSHVEQAANMRIDAVQACASCTENATLNFNKQKRWTLGPQNHACLRRCTTCSRNINTKMAPMLRKQLTWHVIVARDSVEQPCKHHVCGPDGSWVYAHSRRMIHLKSAGKPKRQ